MVHLRNHYGDPVIFRHDDDVHVKGLHDAKIKSRSFPAAHHERDLPRAMVLNSFVIYHTLFFLQAT